MFLFLSFLLEFKINATENSFNYILTSHPVIADYQEKTT